MRLWDRLARRAGYWEGMASGAAVLTTTYGSPDREAILPQFTAWAQAANASNSIVFSALWASMSMLAEGRFKLQAAEDDHLYGSDTSLHILEHPWPGGNSGELIARMKQDASLAGNAYIWNAPGEDRLVRLRPDWTTIVSELVHVPGGGRYRKKLGLWVEPPKSVLGQGDGEFYPIEEVAHWAPVPDPAADFRGMSWLTPIYREIAADDGLTQHKIRYLENAASPNMLVKYTQKLQPGTIDAIRERINARYGGVNNAFKTLVLDQGADATVIGNSLGQMDFANVQQVGVNRILSAANVPPLVVGMEPIQGAGKSYEEVIRRWADISLRPDWRSMCGALQPIVPGIPPAGVRLWVDTGNIAALQDGLQVRAQVSLIRAQSLLAYRQGGATFDSAVKAIDSGDISLLAADPAAPPPGQQAVQHLLPQTQPGVTAKPLPAGSTPRLPVGSVSPGDGGNNTRPVARPSAVRRAIGTNGHGKGVMPYDQR